MKSKVALTVFLGLVVGVLVFFNARAILRPAKYEAIYNERKELNTNRLTIIKTLQELYHERYKRYAPHIDTLIHFYECDSMPKISPVNTYPADSANSESFIEMFYKMSPDERVKCGYVKNVISYVTVKDRMRRELDEMNVHQEGHPITMKDFYLLPYSTTKYKIETPAFDSLGTKYAVYVPIEDLMVNFKQSVPQSFLMQGFYGHMEDVYDPKIKDKSLKDMREITKFKGLQLGDTVKSSTEIGPYGSIQ